MSTRPTSDASPLSHPGLYTDLYELTMAQGYWSEGRSEKPATFDYFFRSNPFGGGYVIFAGLERLLDYLEGLHFGEAELEYLDEVGLSPEFLDALADFEFTAEVSAPRPGEVVFPLEPVVRVHGSILEAQMVETAALNLLNFESLVATKAARMRRVAGDAKLIDFGLRRAQGYGSLQASRGAVIGGFDATSNCLAAFTDDLEASGTQAHSWIQSFETELEAFRAYARTFPDSTILLVDTYDTLESGVPNAITVARELEEQGHRLVGIRLDSGDLAYLSKKARQMLDDAGLDYVKIAASNQLDEHVIRSLTSQGAPIDVFGVGTQLVTAHDDPALDGVYRLSSFDGEHRIKLSENPEKINFPGLKQVWRLSDSEGNFYGDVVGLDGEFDGGAPDGRMYDPAHPNAKHVSVEGYAAEQLLHPVMRDGTRLVDPRETADIANYARRRLANLPDEHQRFENPHIYKVGLSERLLRARDRAITAHQT
jgi:nicotinate phosphoribosyltransferase